MGGIPCNVHGRGRHAARRQSDAGGAGADGSGRGGLRVRCTARPLGSNSLLDLVVFGREAARHCAATTTPGAAHRPLPKDAGDLAVSRLDRFRNAKGRRRTAEVRLDMQRVMQNQRAVFRSGESLSEGVQRLADVHASFAEVEVSGPRAGVEHRPGRDARARQPARAGAGHSALGGEPQGEPRRPRARDFKERDDRDWLKHTLAWEDGSGRVRIDYRPVHLNTLTSDVEPIPPKARTY